MDSPAVVAAGSTAEAKGGVLGELLRVGRRVLDVPDESYLVVRHGDGPAARAFLPGARQPCPYSSSMPGAEMSGTQTPGFEPPPRPPRRVELCLPVAFLTGVTLVNSPASAAFGLAYNRIVLDTARRGGALLFTLDAELPPGQAELDFLAAAARSGPAPFFAIWAGGAPASQPVMSAYRDAVVGHVPGLADAPWFAVVGGGGADDLRQALVGWSGATARARAGAASAARRRVPTAADGQESGWEELLERVVASGLDDVRQALTIELANVHQRCVQDIAFGGGCAGMPATLDRELHALSLHAADRVDSAIADITRDVLAHVLAGDAGSDVLHRVGAAIRDRVEEDRPDLARVLLVTSTSGAVAALPGDSATGALAAYQPDNAPAMLPPLGVGLSASCYQKWRNEKADADAAQAWLRAAIRGCEHELVRAVAERFEVVGQALTGLVGDAVDHGLLLV